LKRKPSLLTRKEKEVLASAVVNLEATGSGPRDKVVLINFPTRIAKYRINSINARRGRMLDELLKRVSSTSRHEARHWHDRPDQVVLSRALVAIVSGHSPPLPHS